MTTIVIKRLVYASPERMFRAWSTAAQWEQWLLPFSYGWSANSFCDFYVGGYFFHDMRDDEGIIYPHTGIYQEIVNQEKIVLTWNSHTVQETVVTACFQPCGGGGVRLTLAHEGILSESLRAQYYCAWMGCLDQLEELLLQPAQRNELYYC